MSDLNFKDKSEKYLRGQMSESEQRSFEKDISQDEQLKDIYNEHKSVVFAIRDREKDAQLGSMLKEIEAESVSDTGKPKTGTGNIRRLLFIAIPAAALIAGIFIGINLLKPQPANHQQLFAAYFEPGPMLSVTRSDETADSLLLQAYLLYQQNQFEDANRIFNQGRLDDLLPIDLNYAGMSALSVHPPNTTIAKRYFEELSSRTGHDFTNSAKWHLALINVLEGNTDEAKPYLEELSTGPSNKYTGSAIELLESIE